MIPSAETKVTFIGDGTATTFPFSFKYAAASDVHVAIYDISTDVTTVLEKDYYVDTTANAVKYPGYQPGQEPAASEQPGPLPAGKKLIVYRETPINQLVDLGDRHPLPIIEGMDDKNCLIIQEQNEKINRCVMVQIGSDVKPQELIKELIMDSAKAETAATTATRSAAAAAASELQASIHEKNAINADTSATNAAGIAAKSASEAAAEMKNAASSAETATSAATVAAESAAESSLSKTAAANSAAAAAASAQEAAHYNNATPLVGYDLQLNEGGDITSLTTASGKVYVINRDTSGRLESITGPEGKMVCRYNKYGQFIGTEMEKQ